MRASRRWGSWEFCGDDKPQKIFECIYGLNAPVKFKKAEEIALNFGRAG